MASFVFGVNLVFGFLEEVGFIARAAYQFDGVLSKLGLQGKAICPILMGFGCTIGGSLLYRIGTSIEPVTRLFGLSWQTFMGFLSSAFAKEAVLGVLNAVFVGQGGLMEATFSAGTGTPDNAVLALAMTQSISRAEALAFMFACTFNVPCVMALSTTYRESHSLVWTARVALFYIGGALLLSGVVYHVAGLFL